MSQSERAVTFKSLHVKSNPLILFNIWDAGSARAVQEAGAQAIATGSWSVAAAHGYEDEQKLPLDLALANLSRIIASVDLPVTFDMEAGYGQSPKEVQSTVSKVLEAGAVGINFEDQIIGKGSLYSVADQSARIQAIREAAERASIPLFINARTDVFFQSEAVNHGENLDAAICRAAAYAQAGASGLFTPGLIDATLIQKLCELSPLPVNIMMLPRAPSSKQLAEIGVARISYGPIPYRMMIQSLKESALNAFTYDR